MPLAFSTVTSSSAGSAGSVGAGPSKWIVFLHGILGSGANWRSFARQIVQTLPDWGAALVDLRLHGDSHDMPPPHTVEAAARDVVELFSSLPGPVQTVFGHSFGGKVAVEIVGQHGAGIEQLFIVDSNPGARPTARGSESTKEVVELLTQLPPEFPDRNAFTAWAEGRGLSRPMAMWLAMNIRPLPNTNRFVFRVDIASVRQMLEDYFLRDLWPVLESPPPGLETHFIVGGKSTVLDASDLERARRCPSTTVDVLEGAGHWVHVDAHDALRDRVLGYLR